MKAPEKRACRTTSRVVSEVLLGLAGEADDDVGGDRRVGHRRADPVDDAEVLRLAVGAAHRPQHPVGAGLQRHVQLRHHVRRLGHRLDDVVGELRRVRRGEAHPLQPLDLAARPQQLGERLPVAELHAVRVDVLPQQRHLADALGDQRPDLGEDSPGRRSFSLPRSDGTMQNVQVLLQPDRDRHPGGVRRLALGRQRRREHLERLEDLDLRLLLRPARARAAPAATPMLWVPNTTSTHGAFSTIVERSFWARQPPTAICMPGCFALTGARWPRLP